jgi:hypothetical protein
MLRTGGAISDKEAAAAQFANPSFLACELEAWLLEVARSVTIQLLTDLAPEKRSSWLMMESETGATR